VCGSWGIIQWPANSMHTVACARLARGYLILAFGKGLCVVGSTAVSKHAARCCLLCLTLGQ
jgi:hypothetical protein